jgi:lipopolysaccharide heptosyltransferase II
MHLKNLLINWVMKLARFVPKHDPKAHRFLIVSTTGLGDTLWGTPAIRALRLAYPHAYIGVLTSVVGKEVLKNNPHIDEFFVVKEPVLLSLIPLFWRLKAREIGTAYIFHTSQRPILPFCHFIGASRIIGTKGINKGLDHLLTEGLEAKPIHEIARRIAIVGAPADDLSMELAISSQDKAAAKSLLKDVPTYVPIVGLHPGAKDRFKQWPSSHFIAVGKALKDHLGCQIIVTGNRDEKTLVETVASGIGGALPLAGQLSMHTLGALIQQMAVMISNDTGPMHIACAVKTPVVGLFAPTDARICGPYFIPKAEAIQKKRTCHPCLKKKCLEPFCMRQISKKEVFDAALRLFYGT